MAERLTRISPGARRGLQVGGIAFVVVGGFMFLSTLLSMATDSPDPASPDFMDESGKQAQRFVLFGMGGILVVGLGGSMARFGFLKPVSEIVATATSGAVEHSSTALAPVADGCICTGFGHGYGVHADEAGNAWAQGSQGLGGGLFTPAGPVADLGSGRWFNIAADAPTGRLDARTDGGASLNTPAGEFAGQDAMLRFDPANGAHAELHDNAGALGQHVGVCLDAAPGDVGADVFTFVGPVVPSPNGVGAGECRFET